MPLVTETQTCLYASRPCAAPRSRKTSGELHRLCDEHRSKANAAQRRWHATITTNKRQLSATQDHARSPRRRRRRCDEEETDEGVPDVLDALHMPSHALSYVDMLSAASFDQEEGQDPASTHELYYPSVTSAHVAAVTVGGEPPSDWASPLHWVYVGQSVITSTTTISL